MTKKIESKPTAKKPTEAPTKKAPKKGTASYEVGNLCVHALALYTNAVIKERSADKVEMLIPLTLSVGKKQEILEITYRADLKTLSEGNHGTMALDELGEFMFKAVCNTVRATDVVVDVVGKPFNTLKQFEIKTGYGDKCIYKNDVLTLVKANAPKTKKK